MSNQKMKFLIVVDLQNSFCPGGELAVKEGDQIVPYVNERLASGDYDRRVASKERHPADHGSFASHYPGKQPFVDTIEIDGEQQNLWPDHCVADTRGEQFHPDFRVDLVDKIVVKGTDPVYHSFSSFWNIPGRQPTDLLQYILNEASAAGVLRQDIEIDVVGLALDYCVRDTAIDAAKFGLNVTLLLAGTRAVNVNAGDDQRAIELMESAGVKVISGRNISQLDIDDFIPADQPRELVQMQP